jgi:hypothetical protein
MKSSVRSFWEQLDGPVHPQDAPVFAKSKHSFNLEFPPPAFIGDVDNAKVIILMASGGYNANTKLEFSAPEDRQEYIDWLAGRRTQTPKNLSKYYVDQKIFSWIDNGLAVIVNAIAYRSPKISKEPDNINLGRSLPSNRVHRAWLHNEVVPRAQSNERLVIAHRYGLWGLNKANPPVDQNFMFSPNPASPYLSLPIKAAIQQWLRNPIPLKV